MQSQSDRHGGEDGEDGEGEYEYDNLEVREDFDHLNPHERDTGTLPRQLPSPGTTVYGIAPGSGSVAAIARSMTPETDTEPHYDEINALHAVASTNDPARVYPASPSSTRAFPPSPPHRLMRSSPYGMPSRGMNNVKETLCHLSEKIEQSEARLDSKVAEMKKEMAEMNIKLDRIIAGLAGEVPLGSARGSACRQTDQLSNRSFSAPLELKMFTEHV